MIGQIHFRGLTRLFAERVSSNPLVPLEIFRSRQFTAANAVTFLVYGALVGALFLLPIQLQRVVGFSALDSGSSLIPMTLLLLGAWLFTLILGYGLILYAIRDQLRPVGQGRGGYSGTG